MPRIRVLPDIVVNKIAAGEIVERPASVVKELVENALDAGANRLEVEIEGGGRSTVVVRDDGCGMDRDDALLAFEHHATSKIRTAEELETVATLGFRGEALPSVAAVSRLTLRTRAADADGPGTRIEIDGGVVRSVADDPWPRGTEVTVRQLFYNLPARRKFLRTETTEAGHVTRLISHYALARPGLHVVFQTDGRVTLEAPPVRTLAERAHQVLGAELAADMIPLDAADGSLCLTGLAAAPHAARSRSAGQYLFVNGRMVRDRVLTMALSQAYRHHLPAGTYAPAVLFLDLPPDGVDVNVHPAKTEVRFRESWRVQSFLVAALAAALEGARPFARLPLPFGRPIPPAGGPPHPAAPAPQPEPGAAQPPEPGARPDPDRVERVNQRLLEYAHRTGGGSNGWHPPPAAPSRPAAPEPTAGLLAGRPDQWRVLGQWRDSYIVAAARDELLLIDQHAAHERVLFEAYLAQLEAGQVPRQRLLLPLSVDLTPDQAAEADTLLAQLAENGFEAERFGRRSLRVDTMPALAGNAEAEEMVREILQRLEGEAPDRPLADSRRRVAAGLACRAAVKANTSLTRDRLEHLLDELLAAGDPTVCPHGRPVVLRLHIRDLERSFLRG